MGVTGAAGVAAGAGGGGGGGNSWCAGGEAVVWRWVVRLMLMCLVGANGVSHRPIGVCGRVLGGRLCGLRLLLEIVLRIMLLPLRVHVEEMRNGWLRERKQTCSSKIAVR